MNLAHITGGFTLRVEAARSAIHRCGLVTYGLPIAYFSGRTGLDRRHFAHFLNAFTRDGLVNGLSNEVFRR